MPENNGQMPTWQIALFGIYLIALNLMMLGLLIYVWPGQQHPIVPPATSNSLLNAFGINVAWDSEPHFLIFVAVCGALGSYIHLASSFADYVGNRQLQVSWLWWYLLRPFVGVSLAVVLYLGMTSIVAQGGYQSLNKYAMAFLAATTGMLSKQITNKISEVYDLLFRTRGLPARVENIKGDRYSRAGKG